MKHQNYTRHGVVCRGVRWLWVIAGVCGVSAIGAAGPDAAPSRGAVEQLAAYLAIERSERGVLAEQPFAATALTRGDADQARHLLWADHVRMIRRTRTGEMAARRLTAGELAMPFVYSVTGDVPEGGRSLYLSLHGGGGTAKRVNDGQWDNQKRLYRIPEGIYLAPRAPTDTWNMWHQGHIDDLFGRLIENLIVLEGVNPNRVYLLGYSAGGDGVYQLAPRMADRFAAAAMMAGHPNEASPLGLRNIPFAIFMGENDSAYNRNTVARQWGERLGALQQDDPDGYVHRVEIYAGKGHWMDGKDAAAIPWMAGYQRNPIPDKIVWKQDDVTHGRFYWLAVDDQNRRIGTEVRATLKGQQFDVQSDDVRRLTLRMDDRMLNLDDDVVVRSGGTPVFNGRVERTVATLAETLAERGDPDVIFSGQTVVVLGGAGSEKPEEK